VGSDERWDVPLRLFAAVHYLVLSGDAPDALSGRFEDFAAALAEHEDALRARIETHGVQTNEVQRCTMLLPTFLAAAAATGLPLELIELGPSAGLNLLVDRYRYGYANGSYGPADALLDRQLEQRVDRAEAPVRVAVPIPVDEKVETCARAELDQLERKSGRGRRGEERRQQHRAALDLVGLDAVRLDPSPQRILVLGESRGKVLEAAAQRVGCDAGEHEEVHGREEAQRHVPALVAPDDSTRRTGIVCKTLGQPGVDRRAERLEVLRLPAEDPGELAQAAFASSPDASAAFAFSATAVNAAGSATARSASDLRSSSIPALWTPFMNWLYDSPFARAAALIRTIQSERKLRFLLRRSR
jgi:hypothetical protein